MSSYRLTHTETGGELAAWDKTNETFLHRHRPSAFSSGAQARTPYTAGFTSPSKTGMTIEARQPAYTRQVKAGQRGMTPEAMMADPCARTMYQGYQAQGGRMPYAQFAVLFGQNERFVTDDRGNVLVNRQ